MCVLFSNSVHVCECSHVRDLPLSTVSRSPISHHHKRPAHLCPLFTPTFQNPGTSSLLAAAVLRHLLLQQQPQKQQPRQKPQAVDSSSSSTSQSPAAAAAANTAIESTAESASLNADSASLRRQLLVGRVMGTHAHEMSSMVQQLLAGYDAEAGRRCGLQVCRAQASHNMCVGGDSVVCVEGGVRW